MKEDLFKQELQVGDYVLTGTGLGHELAVYKVIAITPKMVRIMRLGVKTPKSKKGVLRYSKELFKIKEELVTYYILTQE